MTDRPTAPACFPPPGITGLDPAWSRLVQVAESGGVDRTWHLLDSWACRPNAEVPPALTLLCVHGNPSWSFLWRDLLAKAPAEVRVIAVDQLDMGFSERTGIRHTLRMRIDELCRLSDTLQLSGPLVTVAHDWGGPVSLGWALRHLTATIDCDRSAQAVDLRGVVLTNTAVHQPESANAPAVIRFIRSPFVLQSTTVKTTAFIRGAMQMSKPALSRSVRAGFLAPYANASRRLAIADFVADIPLDDSHESASMLAHIAAGLSDLAQIPSLLLWGARDKVFSDLYLHDLEQRLPRACVHRFADAGHFVTEDADVSGAINSWIEQFLIGNVAESANAGACPEQSRRALADFSNVAADTEAVVEISPAEKVLTFGELASKVEQLAAGMSAFGIQTGQRVAVMVTPGIDLALAVYGCWRLGATLVLVDSGLGRDGMQRALKSADPMYLIGIDKALVAARLLGWPGKRIALGRRSAALTCSLHIATDINSLCKLGIEKAAPAWPKPDVVAAVVFTSGSTGPSKGVVYQHRQVQAQRDVLSELYQIVAGDRLVAAFAPFALYGPTLGVTSIVPDMDVTRPSSLTAKALADAIQRIGATLVFASPAALVNVVATVASLDESARQACSTVRLALSAGAPVRASLLEASRSLFTNADFHTPYGMTEVLPVADISLNQLQQIDKDNADATPMKIEAGVCVGYPVVGAKLSIDPLGKDGKAIGLPTTEHSVFGEIIVDAAHIRYGYDRLWHTQHYASRPIGAHRTGDVGQLDAHGRLWVGGRLEHVIVTSSSPLAPVGFEQLIEKIDNVAMAAVVGVGPEGAQVIVVVLQLHQHDYPNGGFVSLALSDTVRACVPNVDVAAILAARQLPVDRRHNSKVDRTAVSNWASQILAGGKAGAL